MRVNALLVRHRDGYSEVTDSAAITADGRIEGFVNYPEDSAAEAARKAAAQIEAHKSARWDTQVRVIPTGTGDVPFDDWNVGDTITVPDQDGTPAALRVIGLTLTEDENGHSIYEPEVGRPVPSFVERTAQVSRSMSLGTGQGRYRDAMPTTGGASSRAAKVQPPAPDALGRLGSFRVGGSIPSPTGATQRIEFATVQHDHGDALEVNAGDNQQITVLKSGVYRVSINGGFTASGTALQGVSMEVFTSGSDIATVVQPAYNSGGGLTVWFGVSESFEVAAGDWFGAHVTRANGASNIRFSAELVTPA